MVQAAPFTHRHCDQEGPGSKPHGAEKRPGPLTSRLAEEVAFPSLPPLPAPICLLTGPTISETWETVVPEAAPR